MSEEVGEAEEDSVQGIKGDGESFEQVERHVGRALDEGDEIVGTNVQEIFPSDVVSGELKDACSERGDGLFVERCGHGVSENGGLWREVVRHRVEKDVV